MHTYEKIGYFLLGAGVGVFCSTMFHNESDDTYDDYVEQYIPISDRAEQMTIDDIEENVTAFVKENVFSKEDIPNESSIESIEGGERKRYAKMFEDVGKEAVESIIKQSEDMDEDYEDEDFDEDIPPEDDPMDKDEYVLERVEDDIEIYLDEAPQEFVTLIFYEGDHTLCDDREQLITNADEVVGTVAIDRLISGGDGADDNTIFVRNLRTMINYEIVLDSGKYSETVLGIFEENLEKGSGGDVNS